MDVWWDLSPSNVFVNGLGIYKERVARRSILIDPSRQLYSHPIWSSLYNIHADDSPIFNLTTGAIKEGLRRHLLKNSVYFVLMSRNSKK